MSMPLRKHESLGVREPGHVAARQRRKEIVMYGRNRMEKEDSISTGLTGLTGLRKNKIGRFKFNLVHLVNPV
jgi:hypothetical protein